MIKLFSTKDNLNLIEEVLNYVDGIGCSYEYSFGNDFMALKICGQISDEVMDTLDSFRKRKCTNVNCSKHPDFHNEDSNIVEKEIVVQKQRIRTNIECPEPSCKGFLFKEDEKTFVCDTCGSKFIDEENDEPTVSETEKQIIEEDNKKIDEILIDDKNEIPVETFKPKEDTVISEFPSCYGEYDAEDSMCVNNCPFKNCKQVTEENKKRR